MLAASREPSWNSVKMQPNLTYTGSTIFQSILLGGNQEGLNHVISSIPAVEPKDDTREPGGHP